VLAHELAHELLHHGKEEPRLPKVVRETQAEAVAYVVSRAVGLGWRARRDSNSRPSASKADALSS
jgi:hypothetical protein